MLLFLSSPSKSLCSSWHNFSQTAPCGFSIHQLLASKIGTQNKKTLKAMDAFKHLLQRVWQWQICSSTVNKTSICQSITSPKKCHHTLWCKILRESITQKLRKNGLNSLMCLISAFLQAENCYPFKKKEGALGIGNTFLLFTFCVSFYSDTNSCQTFSGISGTSRNYLCSWQRCWAERLFLFANQIHSNFA